MGSHALVLWRYQPGSHSYGVSWCSQRGRNHLQHFLDEHGRVGHYHEADQDYAAGDELWASYDFENVRYKKCNFGAYAGALVNTITPTLTLRGRHGYCGWRVCAEFLFQYGFVVQDLYADCLRITLSLKHNNFHRAQWLLLQFANLVPEAVDHNPGAPPVKTSLTLRLGSHLPDELVNYFRISNLIESEYM